MRQGTKTVSNSDMARPATARPKVPAARTAKTVLRSRICGGYLQSVPCNAALALIYHVARLSHVREAVFVNKPPRPLNEQGFKIVIGIASLVSGCPVANFEVDNLLSGFIDQAVSVTCARLETGAHSGTELGSPFICVKCWSTLENIDKLVLLGVRVTKGRNCIGSQARKVYAKVCEAKE